MKQVFLMSSCALSQTGFTLWNLVSRDCQNVHVPILSMGKHSTFCFHCFENSVIIISETHNCIIVFEYGNCASFYPFSPLQSWISYSNTTEASIYWATRLVGHVWHSGILVLVAFNGAFKFAVQGMFQHVHINYSLAKPTLKTIGFGGARYGA